MSDLQWLDEIEVLEKAADLDPLESHHIISSGYTHLANLTEVLSDPQDPRKRKLIGRGRCLAMIPKEWSDYLAKLDNAAPRLLKIARVASALSDAIRKQEAMGHGVSMLVKMNNTRLRAELEKQ